MPSYPPPPEEQAEPPQYYAAPAQAAPPPAPPPAAPPQAAPPAPYAGYDEWQRTEEHAQTYAEPYWQPQQGYGYSQVGITRPLDSSEFYHLLPINLRNEKWFY